MCLQFGFIIFWRNYFGTKAVNKMLVKLTRSTKQHFLNKRNCLVGSEVVKINKIAAIVNAVVCFSSSMTMGQNRLGCFCQRQNFMTSLIFTSKVGRLTE
jgi:hypothetical protein